MDGLANDEIKIKAKGYALRLFKLRPRSAAELLVKLKVRGFPAEVSLGLVDDLTRMGYIDDAAFARLWMQGRLKKYGIRRIERELADKGILKATIDRLKDELRAEDEEIDTARELAGRRIRLYAALPVLKRKKRMMDYLTRRGFSGETALKVLSAFFRD